MAPGHRYDHPGLSPEYIARERARKKLANRRQWVEKWWPRIEADVQREDDDDDDTRTAE